MRTSRRVMRSRAGARGSAGTCWDMTEVRKSRRVMSPRVCGWTYLRSYLPVIWDRTEVRKTEKVRSSRAGSW
jgi:hypothetical protein